MSTYNRHLPRALLHSARAWLWQFFYSAIVLRARSFWFVCCVHSVVCASFEATCMVVLVCCCAACIVVGTCVNVVFVVVGVACKISFSFW